MTSPIPPIIVCSYNCMSTRCPSKNGACKLAHRFLDTIDQPFYSEPFVGQEKFRMQDSNREFVLHKTENVNKYKKLFLNRKH